MEDISILNDEKPASKAAILNLPGESVLGVNETTGYTLPALFLLFTDSPLGPFVVEGGLFDGLLVLPFFHMSRERGRSEGRDCPHCKNGVGTLNILDEDLDQT